MIRIRCELHPGQCMQQADCPDTLCPGRPRYIHREGGYRISDNDSVRLDPPLVTPEQAEDWSLLVLVGIFCAVVVFAVWTPFFFK